MPCGLKDIPFDDVLYGIIKNILERRPGLGKKGAEVKKTSELDIKGTVVRVVKINGEDFVCLTDMAKLKSEDAQQTITS